MRCVEKVGLEVGERRVHEEMFLCQPDARIAVDLGNGSLPTIGKRRTRFGLIALVR